MASCTQDATSIKYFPRTTYQGLFQNLLLAGHAIEFPDAFVVAVYLLLPLLGFAAYRTISGQPIGREIWRPLLIVALSVPVFRLLFIGTGVDSTEWHEGARALFVLLLMVWSAEPRRPRRSPELLVLAP